MKKTFIIITNLFAILTCFNSFSQSNIQDWKVITKYSKSVDNVIYIFPSSVQEQTRNEFIKSCIVAINDNLSLINEKVFNDTITIEFLDNKQQIFKYSGLFGSGVACADRKIMFALTNTPPLKHELMHMISGMKWGNPAKTTWWMTEGLATFASGTCSGFTVEQIYTYLLVNNMLIPIDKLSENFYKNSEMIAYHQCGYLVEYLLKNYGLDKFQELWKKGMDSFENIYSFSFADLTQKIESDIKLNNKIVPEINWKEFDKGCK